jgi:hypothetical protein
MRRAVVLTVLALAILPTGIPHIAAAVFADPRFQAQWVQGESLMPNFWGPSATDPVQEPYAESPDGKRLTQYFDKGRMELTHPDVGVVTMGLLAKELITGNMQVGDSTYVYADPPAIPLAGDMNGTGPTYASFHGISAPVLAAAPQRIGAPIQIVLADDGSPTSGDVMPQNGGLPISVYDNPTQHNVLTPFSQMRNRVGIGALGYAISEPFIAPFTVGGQRKFLAVQIFERRVLTYTYDNPDSFRTEFSNIGRHYYTWRYPAK